MQAYDEFFGADDRLYLPVPAHEVTSSDTIESHDGNPHYVEGVYYDGEQLMCGNCRGVGMTTRDRLRSRIADLIRVQREEGCSMPSSAHLAGLTEDEWTAQLVLDLIEQDKGRYSAAFIRDMES